MMELNKTDWYTVQAYKPNDFLNNNKTPQEIEQYGLIYSVQFVGDADTYLWSSKTAPVSGEKYYGHFEPAKSGKSTWFRKDKMPSSEPASATPSGRSDQKFLKDISDYPLRIYNGSLNYAKDLGLNLIDNIDDLAKYFDYVEVVTNRMVDFTGELRKRLATERAIEKPALTPTPKPEPKPTLKEQWRQVSGTDAEELPPASAYDKDLPV